MRHFGYIREGEVTECMRFDRSHYEEASVPYTPAVGVHESAALYLMNHWNCTRPDYKYYLGDGE
jgi:hypothetical protein